MLPEEMGDMANDTTQNGDYRAGFVAVVGRPNVGKSTLINRLVGQKIAITSPKPQTTRVNQLGILTLDGAQMVFVDTPGMHVPAHALGRQMVGRARESLKDADVVLALMDVSRPPNDEDRAVAEAVRSLDAPKILGLNKLDLLDADMLDTAVDAYHVIGRWDETVAFSATAGTGVDALLDVLRQRLPLNPPFYPEEEVTQTNARDIAAELIREQVLRHTREEVPHAVAVVVEDYKERPDGMLYVSANIYVERDSQKGIIIGRGAEMLKTIGSAARKEIETMADSPVYLDLHVKVRKDWRKKEPNLQQSG
jgi:GTP-binding protein Era